MYDDILIPTDGAPGFEEVVEHASSIAEKFDATIHAINVVDTRTFVDSMDMAYVVENLEKFGEDKTQEVGEKAREHSIPVIEDVEQGIPHQRILEYTEENGVDLIVMGTHGRTGLGRIVMGSVAEKVIRKSEVPVMTVEIGEVDE